MKLGKREIDAIRCPPGRRDTVVFDSEIPGFGLRVTEAGTKSFLLQYQIGGRGGRRQRLVLGRHGEVTAIQARRSVEAARALVLAHRDPKEESLTALAAAKSAARERRRQIEADAFTVETLVEQWADVALANRSEGHRKEAPRAIRTCFPAILKLPATAVASAVVQRSVDTLAKRTPIMARRAHSYAQAMYAWAIRRKLVEINTFAGVVVEGREISRDRVLTDVELGETWRAAGELGYPFGPLVRFLMLTLQRRSEVAGMRWTELSEDLSTWTIPGARAKNGRAHIVHLAEPARAIVAGLSRLKGVPLVFHSAPGRGAAGSHRGRVPVSGFSDAKERLQAAIGKERARCGIRSLKWPSGDVPGLALARPPSNRCNHHGEIGDRAARCRSGS